MTDAAILTSGLTKHYGDFVALTDLDLEVHRGEVFGFLGPNGAGKTTMIRTLTDEIRATSGTAQVVGLDSRRDSVAIRSHLGYLPADLTMYPDLTGLQTLTYFANLRGGVDWDVVHRLAERLDADLTRKVGDLSTGNRQKIGLVQAFMNHPDVIIMDEPSTGLDPLVQHEFQAMVREVADEGRTVFLSSHTLSEVERVADRVGIIRHGRLVTVETVAALQAKAIRSIEFTFDAPCEPHVLAAVDGVRKVRAEGRKVTVAFDGSMTELLRAASLVGPSLIDIHTREPDLEEIFLAYYRDDDQSPAGVSA